MCKTVPTSVALLLLGVILAAALPARAASVSMREGLYLEEVEGDLDGAIAVYQGIIADEASAENIVAQALYRQGLCYIKQGHEAEAKAAFTEILENHSNQTDLISRVRPLLDDLGNADPAALMPPDTIAYVELGSPGKQFETILNMLKGTPLENPLEMLGMDGATSGSDEAKAVAAFLNPSMTNEFKKIRGLGVGVTNLSDDPSLVAVLFPGKSDAIRGLLLFVFNLVGRTTDDVEQMHCIRIPDNAGVAYDDNIVIVTNADPNLEQLRWCIRQYKGLSNNPTLASSNASFRTVDKKARQDNAVTAWVNANEIYNNLSEIFPGGRLPTEIQMVNGFVDFAHIKELIASLALQPAGLKLEADVNLAEGHNCMAYRVGHTPALNKDALRAVPADAIAVVSIGLGDSNSMQAQLIGQQIANALGINIGNQFFDNVGQMTVFATPFVPVPDQSGANLSSLGLIISSDSPQGTYEFIGTALKAMNIPAEMSEPVDGQYEIALPGTLPVVHGYMDRNAGATILSLSPAIIEKSQAARGAAAGPLASAIEALPETTNKLVLVNIGGLLEFGAAASSGDDEELLEEIRSLLDQLAQASSQSMIQLSTSEEDNRFGLRLAVSDLPPAAEIAGPITELVQLVQEAQSRSTSWAMPDVEPVTIFTTKTAPVIDGKIDAVWANARSYAIDASLYEKPASPEDCSASYKLLTDSDHLYILVDVNDETLIHDSADRYEDDSIEIFIRADDAVQTYQQRNHHYYFVWDDTSPQTAQRTIRTAGGNSGEFDRSDDSGAADFAMVKTGTGYLAEISLPWAAFGIKPEAGTSIGLDVHVNDDDNGGSRDSKQAWFGRQDIAWTTPQYLGIAIVDGPMEP